ncbi:MAG: S41 family peptidase [Fimbriimonadaceae bacterium]
MARAFARLTALVATLGAFSTSFGQTAPPTTPPVTTTEMTAETKAAILKGVEETVLTRAFVPGVDFTKWTEFITKRQAAIDEAKDEAAFGRVVNQALRDFGFSHIRLANPRSTAARGQTSSVGTGAAVVPHEEGLRVNRVTERGPAAELGLAVGDIITKIDGKKPESADELNGEEGAKKKVEVKKASGELKELELEIKKFSTVRPETLTWLDAETAVLRVFTFSAGYSRENLDKLVGEAAKAKYLVLDLRSNGGGAVNNLNHLLSLLMPDGTTIGTFVNKRMANEYLEKNPEGAMDPIAIATWTENKSKTRERSVKPFAGKIAVLINRGSASASEICAAALKENVGAVLVGSRTAGAVLASTYARLPEGWSLQFPVSDFVTGKGMRLEANPLQPDIEETGRPGEDGVDPVVQAAVKSLQSSTKIDKAA